MEHKMYFNTGVRPENRPANSLMPFQSWRGGTLHVEYTIENEPPTGARLLYLSNTPENNYGRISIKITGGGMLSEYAIFQMPYINN
jgi:hypothetical protein